MPCTVSGQLDVAKIASQLSVEALGLPFVLERAGLHPEHAAVARNGAAGNDANLHRRDPWTNHVELLRCGVGEIEDTTAYEGPSVGNSDLDLPPIVAIVHLDDGVERQRSMGRGKGVLVVDFAVGSSLAVKPGSIPRGQASFGIAATPFVSTTGGGTAGNEEGRQEYQRRCRPGGRSEECAGHRLILEALPRLQPRHRQALGPRPRRGTPTPARPLGR